MKFKIILIFILFLYSPPAAGSSEIYNAAMRVLERGEPAESGLGDRVRKAQQSAEKAESEALESLVTGGASIAYGELLSHAQNAGMAQFSAEAWKGGQVAKDLARANRFRGYTGKLNTALGRATGALRLGENIYMGDVDEAAITGVTMVLSELPNLPGGPAMMKYVGISGPVLGAAILTFNIWRASEQALAEARAGVHLQSLFYSVERMCRDRDRQLGIGDPIPVSSENIEKVWRRLLTDKSFRENFRSYVEVELKEDFPDTGWFRSVADSLYTFGGTQTAEDMQQRRIEAELHEKESDIKAYISGVLSRLNMYWKAREEGVIARQVGRALAGDIDRASKSLESGVARVAYAAQRLDDVTFYAEESMGRVERAADERDFRVLMYIRSRIYDYVKDIIAWIPDGEPLGEQKQRTFELLRDAYVAAGNELIEIRASIQERMRRPETEEVEYEYVPITASMLYNSHMVPVIENWPEFNWGWTDNKEVLLNDMREHFSSLFESGKKEAMENSIRAWKAGAHGRAIEDLTGADQEYAIPEEETIAFYSSSLRSITIPPPPELSQDSGYSPSEKREIQKEWNKAGRMYREAVELKVELINQKHEEVLQFMERTYSFYEELYSEIKEEAEKTRSRFWSIYNSLAPDESPAERLRNAKNSYEEIRYTGLPRYETRPEENVFSQAQLRLRRSRHDIRTRLDYLEQAVEGWISDHRQAVEEFDAAVRETEPDIEIIRRHYDDEFLADTYYIISPRPGRHAYADGLNYAQVRSRRSQTPGYIASLRSHSAALAAEMQRDINNIDMAIFWIERAKQDYNEFMQMREKFFLIPAGGWRGREFHEFGSDYDGDYTLLEGKYAGYFHFLSEKKKSEYLSELRNFYETSYLGGFIDQVAPYRKGEFNRFFQELQKAQAYPYNNFFIRFQEANFDYGTSHNFIKYRDGSYGLVDSAGVRAAREILDDFEPETRQRIDETLRSMQAQVPLPAFHPERRIWIESFPAQETELGKMYIELMKDISEKWAEAYRLAATGHTPARGSTPPEDEEGEEEVDITSEVEEFYRNFKRAYEAGNDIRIISMLDDRWSSSDGTRLAEVEDHFRRMFNIYDTIRYDISRIRSSRSGDVIRVDYELEITGRIFRNNITHREKSSVTEELKKDGRGQLKIIRTLQGRFWTE